MNTKLKKSLLGLSLGLAVVAATPAYSSKYFFEDDDLEWVLRSDGAGGYTEVISGNLMPGDVLYAAFEFPIFQIDGVNAIPSGMELTGVSAIEVATIVGNAYTFQAWSGFGYGAGSTSAMFFNDLTTDLDLVGTNPSELSCTTRAACTAQATEGSLFQIDGLLGDADNFWTGIATTNDIGVIKAGAATRAFVFFDAGLSNLYNAWGPVDFIKVSDGSKCTNQDPNPLVNKDGCVQFLVSGSVLGGAGLDTTNIVGRSDIQGQKYVPEPVTMALLGIGLLGFGASRRRI